jgi:diguanylate cyclase (GGDEF)-like protein
MRFSDPNLTVPHMLLSIGLVLYLQIYAGQARGGYLLALMLTFAFGCFKLKRFQVIWLSLVTVIAYVCTIPIIMEIERERFNPAVELVLWVAFGIFIPALAMLTSSFKTLHKHLIEANQKLTDLNNFDGLTGVKNRSCFNQQFEHEWRRSQRSSNAVSLLMIDIDHFKSINDTYGHLGGDVCLKQVANLIKNAARRTTDGAFRYGGEEFAVLLAATDAAASIRVAESIRKLVEDGGIFFNDKPIAITVSIGVATVVPSETQEHSGEMLIVQADEALYQAKKNGRNRVCVYGACKSR